MTTQPATASQPLETPMDQQGDQLLARCVTALGWCFAAEVVLMAFVMRGAEIAAAQAAVWGAVATLCVLGAITTFARAAAGHTVALGILGAILGVNLTALIVEASAGVAPFAPVPGPLGTLLLPAFFALVLHHASSEFGSQGEVDADVDPNPAAATDTEDDAPVYESEIERTRRSRAA